jgi:carboxy-terminal domain RNA polymerase II polypeptide A small phosphatase
VEIFIRPFAKEFLSMMAEYFEVVIFTSSMPSYSEHIIDKFSGVSYKLFRYHATRLKGRMIKDLSRLGRPLNKTIIIDNDE